MVKLLHPHTAVIPDLLMFLYMKLLNKVLKSLRHHLSLTMHWSPARKNRDGVKRESGDPDICRESPEHSPML